MAAVLLKLNRGAPEPDAAARLAAATTREAEAGAGGRNDNGIAVPVPKSRVCAYSSTPAGVASAASTDVKRSSLPRLRAAASW
jgi:hypothetical protein